jgi:transposase
LGRPSKYTDEFKRDAVRKDVPGRVPAGDGYGLSLADKDAEIARLRAEMAELRTEKENCPGKWPAASGSLPRSAPTDLAAGPSLFARHQGAGTAFEQDLHPNWTYDMIADPSTITVAAISVDSAPLAEKIRLFKYEGTWGWSGIFGRPDQQRGQDASQSRRPLDRNLCGGSQWSVKNVGH